jgi:hypothetical protein
MINEVLIYTGAAVIMLWGIAHIIPTKQIVKGFGAIAEDNKKILTMEVIAEGLTLIFLGVLPILVTAIGDSSNLTAQIIYVTSGVLLLVMAILTLATGARTPTIWYRICPVVKTVVAVLYIFGGTL